MKNLFLLSFVFFFNMTTSYCQNWNSQFSGTSATLNDISFINTGTGFIVGDSGVILKTTNSGLNWNRIDIGIRRRLISVCCTDINTCYIGGGDEIYIFHGYVHRDRIVLKTTNQGINWVIIQDYSSNAYPVYDMQFLNSQTGWYSCSGLVKTSDGGVSWQDKQAGAYKSFFIDESNGFYFTPNITSIFRTSNDGQSWINVGTYYCEGGFYFTNSFTGYACGTSGIEKTTNGGYNWFSVLNTNNVYGIHFSNDNTGFVTGHNGIIHKTTNGGINWVSSYLPGGTLYSVFTLNDSASWTVGVSGRIFSTITSPNSILNVSNSIPESFSLSQNYPNPFNPNTIINYAIPSNVRSQTSDVKLLIYNSLGKHIATLVNENQNAGIYSVEFNGEGLPSGVYYCKLEAGDFVETKRMVLLK